jgi:LPXTG-motif cell wall-anchored protein
VRPNGPGVQCAGCPEQRCQKERRPRRNSRTTPAPIAQDTSTGTEPQASQGGLAETGAQLWPAAAGAVLVLAGVVLLFRRGRRSF